MADLNTAPNIFPCLRYRDAPAAIEWLGKAFGFEAHMVVPGPDGTIAHAELRLGAGMIMMGSMKDDAHVLLSPKAAGGSTQSVYLVVDDADALLERAKKAGAEIFFGPVDTDYGSRDFGCRDPEGHVWNFGTYSPYAPAS
jgi:uncharacterized glyoxalase superfamily protein PhnB